MPPDSSEAMHSFLEGSCRCYNMRVPWETLHRPNMPSCLATASLHLHDSASRRLAVQVAFNAILQRGKMRKLCSNTSL